MLEEIIKKKEYLPILKMNDGSDVTLENWNERRKEMIELLEKYSYGRTPEQPSKLWGEVVEKQVNSYGGKAYCEKIEISFETSYGLFKLPFELYVPYRVVNPSVFLHIAFRPAPDKFIPVEEILDGGYALAVVTIPDMVNDNGNCDFSDGLGKYFGLDKGRRGDDPGKVSLWAYGASRVMDYLVKYKDDIDTNCVAVIGHSRLGKTALWCGAQDERISAVISNNSGYGGACSSKDSHGEKIEDFIRVKSWELFCENFLTFKDKENEKPYDQAFLLALIAPRLLLVGSASRDIGAYPEGEFLTTLYASQVWEFFGKKGLICPDRLPEVNDNFTEGDVNYHLRDDLHFLSREDWQVYMGYLDLKFGKKERSDYHLPIVNRYK